MYWLQPRLEDALFGSEQECTCFFVDPKFAQTTHKKKHKDQQHLLASSFPIMLKHSVFISSQGSNHNVCNARLQGWLSLNQELLRKKKRKTPHAEP